MGHNFSYLKKETDEFFSLHWNQGEIGYPPPLWSLPYLFIGSTPNHDKQGVYAFLRNDEVIYIGVGASRGSGKYVGAGIGARLHGKYLRVKEGGRSIEDLKRPYKLIDEWKEVDQIITIGFKRENSYIAYALESYLITKLSPQRNMQKPGQ